MSFRDGTGFGHYPFGHFPFGHADYGHDVVVRSFPEEYLEDENDPTGVNQLLLHFLSLVKDSVNRVKEPIDNLGDQIDFDRIQQNLLVELGRTIAVELDDVEPIEFQRSLVGGAVQFYRIKGTLQSYKIRGKISGFDVSVFNLFKIALIYVPLFSVDNLFELPTGSGNWYTDLPPGSVSGTPTEVGCDYCLTSAIKMSFTVVKDQPPSVIGQANFFDRLVFKLRDIIPIHVRDLLFEIIANIAVDEHQYLDVINERSIEETYTPCSLFHSFDVTPADTRPLETHGYIQGTATIVDFP